MKRLGLLTIAALLGVSPALGAQRGDALDRLKGCSQFEGSERLKCVDELLGEVAPEAVDTQQSAKRPHRWTTCLRSVRSRRRGFPRKTLLPHSQSDAEPSALSW